MDIRTRRTYDMLFDALTDLLKDSRFDEITVSEICSQSTVHRTTFYKHFGDKYEFYRVYLEHMTREFIDRAPDVCALNDINEYCRHMFCLLIDFIDGHEGIAKRLIDDTMAVVLLDMIVKEMARGIVARLRSDDDTGLPPMLQAVFYSGGLVQALRWWLSENRPITKEELIAGIGNIGLSEE